MSDPPPVFHGDKNLGATVVKKKFPRVLAITNKSVARTQQIIIEMTRKGFVVETAGDQRTAIRKWKYPGYHDLVLVDFNLGDHSFDGNYLASAIRKAESQEQFTSKAQKEHREKLLRLVSTHTNASKEELRAKMLGQGVQRTTMFGLWDSADEYKKMSDLRLYDALIRHPLDVHIQYLQETFVSLEEVKRLEEQPSTEQMIGLLATTHVNRLPGDTVTNFLATTGTLSGKGGIGGRKGGLEENGNPEGRSGFKFQGSSFSSSILPQTNAVRQMEKKLEEAEDALRDETSARMECERLTDEAHSVSRELRADLEKMTQERDSLKGKVESLEILVEQRTTDLTSTKKEYAVLAAMMKPSTAFTRTGQNEATADAKQMVEENGRLREENFEVNSRLHTLKVNLRHNEIKYAKLKEKYEQTRKMLNKALLGREHQFGQNVESPLPMSPKSELEKSESEGVTFDVPDSSSIGAQEGQPTAESTVKETKSNSKGLTRLRNSVTKISASLKVARSVLSPEQMQPAGSSSSLTTNMRGISFFSNPSFVQGTKSGRSPGEILAKKAFLRQQERNEMRMMELHDEVSRVAVHENFFARGLLGPSLGLPPPIDVEADESVVAEQRELVNRRIKAALQPPVIGGRKDAVMDPIHYEPKLRRRNSPQSAHSPISVLSLSKLPNEQEIKQRKEQERRESAKTRPLETGSLFERSKDGIFQEWEATGRALAELETVSKHFTVTDSLTIIAELHTSGNMSNLAQQVASKGRGRKRGAVSLTSSQASASGLGSPKSPKRRRSAKRIDTEGESELAEQQRKEMEATEQKRKELVEAEERASKDLGTILRTPLLRQYIKNRILANGNVRETDDYHIESTYEEVFEQFKHFLEEVLQGYKRLLSDIVTDMMRLFYKETALLDMKERAMFERVEVTNKHDSLPAEQAPGKSEPVVTAHSQTFSDSNNSEFNPGKSAFLARSSIRALSGNIGTEGPTSPLTKRQVSPPQLGSSFSTTKLAPPSSSGSPGLGASILERRLTSGPTGSPQVAQTTNCGSDTGKVGALTAAGLVPGSLTPHHQVMQHLTKHFHHIIRQGTKNALELHLRYLERFSSHASASIDTLNRLVLPLVHQVEGGKKEGNIRHTRVNFAQTDPVTIADAGLDASASRRGSIVGSDGGSMWSSGPFTPGIHAPRRPSLQATGTDFSQSASTRSPIQRSYNSRASRSPPNSSGSARKLSKSGSASIK